MLSLLPFWRARFERYSAAACAAGSIPTPLSEGKLTPFFLCQSRIRLRARSHTSSLVITSHKPSLARTRHSSSFARGRNITSGSGMIHGFKYLSPAIHMEHLNNHAIWIQPQCFGDSKSWHHLHQQNTVSFYSYIHIKRIIIIIITITTNQKSIFHIPLYYRNHSNLPFVCCFRSNSNSNQVSPTQPQVTEVIGDWPPYQQIKIATINRIMSTKCT